MDTRNYNEPSNCGLERCECSDDDNCGCSFPNNVSDYTCNCTPQDHCGCINGERLDIKDKGRHIKKDTVCFCSPEECSCTVERNETEI